MSLPWEFHPVDGVRTRLDLLREDDLDALHAIQSDPEVCRYLLYEPRTRDEVERRIAEDSTAMRLEKNDDYVQPAIRDLDGTLLGTMYFHLTSVDDLTAEIGWLLGTPYQGRGHAREAAELVLEQAFDEVGLHRVYAELDPRNAASVALCLRLGMRHEAHFVEHMRFKGEWADTGVYAILDHEWRARRT
ncbi:MAG: GNAT family N-acetyltransferase [Microbacterium sp.]|uniref:GNAT family N-acetyltransferase n=1 Tax=Microbacterium sp. TaxID=51671 RepID=UPI001AC63F6E|nr:GNAT family protein [Microbacterium sp.]MBN9154048.1 GNAT family N-acetyltransferase [Microbacterium sp.]MBN9172217.1 GNAT family N-acetyltransferase [Microbacterium sp.]MBN9182695.1 GNAT family N-acetyltransferase [Microbacterium sp.]